MKLSVKARASLRMMFGGKCAYCGCELPERRWHADHVEPVLRDFKWVRVENNPRGYSHVARQTGDLFRPENDTINNLFPTCVPCNIDKGAWSLEDWRKNLEARPSVCRRNHSAFRHAERFGLVVVVEKPIVFWFEQFRADANLPENAA